LLCGARHGLYHADDRISEPGKRADAVDTRGSGSVEMIGQE
jgi:hypothetical protein